MEKKYKSQHGVVPFVVHFSLTLEKKANAEKPGNRRKQTGSDEANGEHCVQEQRENDRKLNGEKVVK